MFKGERQPELLKQREICKKEEGREQKKMNMRLERCAEARSFRTFEETDLPITVPLCSLGAVQCLFFFFYKAVCNPALFSVLLSHFLKHCTFLPTSLQKLCMLVL